MIPSTLHHALQSEVALVKREEIARAAADLSSRYRTGRLRPDGRFASSRGDVAAYAAFRMPATYAAVHAVLAEVNERLPGMRPRTLVDAGAGPGTATWAATAIWPTIERCTLIEREPEMIALGKRLAIYSSLPPVRDAAWIRADLTSARVVPDADVIVSAYVLGELGDDRIDPVVDRLWAATVGALVLIEPGTPAGFARIRRSRERLVAVGARVVAPCPHSGACPVSDGDWCHFGARVERSRLHRQLKEGELPYEDEKYSYVVLSQSTPQAFSGRVIRRPEAHKGHVRLHVCTAKGIEEAVISRRERERYRAARKRAGARLCSAWPKAIRKTKAAPDIDSKDRRRVWGIKR